MKYIGLIIISSLVYCSQAAAWTKSLDFDGLSNGATKQLGFARKSLTQASNKYSNSGGMAIEMGINGGSTGDNEFGGHTVLPPKSISGAPALGEGSEIWYRIWYYFPTNFDFSATGAGLKLSRIHTRKAGGGHDGYHTLLINNGIVVISETDPDFYKINKTNGLGTNIPKGQWHAIEHYVKFHSQRGKGVYRVWQNGKLIFEDMASATLNSPSSKADDLLFFTYWNGGAPKTQQLYIDDMVVTTDTPSASDAHGNPYIGIGDVSITAKPNPPSFITVK